MIQPARPRIFAAPRDGKRLMRMRIVGGKDNGTAFLGLDFNTLAIEKGLAAFKIIIEIADNTHISRRNSLLDFFKTAREQNIINVALVLLTGGIAQN